MRGALVSLLLTAQWLAAQDLPPEVLMLARIRARVKEMVDRLPDCTCLETVSREMKFTGKPALPLDTMVFQVLFTGGGELFASPGGTRWVKHPAAFLTSGMISDGLFALHLRAVFLNNQSVIRYAGEESAGGRRAARYDFSISQMQSGYVVTRGALSDTVGMAGSFWADPDSYELYRLHFQAEEIPAALGYHEITTDIRYDRVKIGGMDVRLPQHAELRNVGKDGGVDRDEVEFTHCHGFQTESTVRFGESEAAAVGGAPSARIPDAETPLAADLRVTVALTTPIDDRTPVAGLVEGKVIGNVMRKGQVVIPDGARIEGRIRRMERYKDAGGFFVVALEFTRIEWKGGDLRFYADLLDLERREGIEVVFGSSAKGDRAAAGMGRGMAGFPTQVQGTVEEFWTREVPGVGTFFAHGAHFLLPAGFRTTWKTRAFPQASGR